MNVIYLTGRYWLAVGLVLGSMLATAAEETVAAKTPPLNLLVLMTDQHHAQWLGCAGNPVVKTPNLDRLAAGGVRFSHAFAPVPYCTPTRMAIETGLCPSSLGVGRNIDQIDDPLRLREPQQVYQHLLAARGYHCYQLGKWHLGVVGELNCFAPEAEGKEFHQQVRARRQAAGASAYEAELRPGEVERVGDVCLREEIAKPHREMLAQKNRPKQDVGVIGRSTVKPEFQYESLLADRCIELIKKHRSEPFAITYSVSPPHAPCVAPAPYYDMYDPAKLPLPATWSDRPALWMDAFSTRMCRSFGEAGFREWLRCYSAQVTMMDACIGRILTALEEEHLAERTLVIFTSDHGTLLGQHGMMDKSVEAFYDDLMRVPLLMRLPGVIPAGKSCDRFVTSMDLPVSILDYLGAPPLTKSHGESVRDLVTGKSEGRTVVFGERGDPKSPNWSRMIRTAQWKFCLRGRGGRELYNLEKDPDELVNLAADPLQAERIQQLEKQLRAHMAGIGDAVLVSPNK